MTVETYYYGMISDKLERSSEQLSFDNESIEINLRNYFENRYPVLKGLTYKIAVNQELTEVISTSSSINEIALLPPFAGG